MGMKRGLWRRDWVVALVVTAVFLPLWLLTSLVSGIENRAYDMGVRLTERSPDPRIAVIAIDQQSLDNIGRWPWSREVHAKAIRQLAGGGAKVVAFTVFFTEPQADRGLPYLQQFQRRFRQNPEAYPDGFGRQIDEALIALDVDSQLATSIKQAGNVVLPMLFAFGEGQGEPDKPLPDYVARIELEPGGDPANGLPLPVNAAVVPIPQLGAAATAVASESLLPDSDGVVRRVPLAVNYFGALFPTYPLTVAARTLNLDTGRIGFDLGRSVTLGNVTLPVASDATFMPYFYSRDGKPAFTVDSFYDVYAGKIPAEKYRGKVVLIGATALGVGASYVTPGSAATSPVLLAANTLSSLLQQHYFVAPHWAPGATLGLVLLVALYLTLLLPRLGAGMAAGVTLALLVAFLVAHFALMTQAMLWVPLMAPALLLLLGHAVLTTKRFLVTEEQGQKSAAESAESNRMLGLAFQGQGQLDMAFDKFRRVPLDDDVMELLYNLALDFERKRQFNKAENVYRYMAKHDAKYRDLPEKLKRAKQMSETVILGGGSAAGGTVLLAGGDVEKPMLGRYQVEKELGKGAMGVVYMGRDPKIGRVVAIKTMALSQEFEPDMLDEARSRFFREAETAGRLSHPNIVAIFDAGEEHDLAFIAMEFLKGQDLAPFTRPDQLLPLIDTVAVVRQVAEALDYAHKNGVVHRDIKPANIMYEPEGKTVKVTDFGIARITDSSKTRTGMVLGTPSYMSPEQLSGKKIDGRSDLFSLGVMLYQLSTGQLPFTGESMAELMFRIANESPADPRTLNPRLPGMLAAIIMKALQKKAEERFQSGAHFAAACAKLEAGLKQRAQQHG
ncbi:CHASE2 domain-containing serine/threonine-protein kinase [Chitinolyticbacter meiyuanensis]|uniref:CHASE2 domain-containing serine/threonine-protein kinase n=1 Tax=Chitinolyticbacter meiyuanensis TaxID=682798 RepID=UPI0011E5E4C6|nr:serine/threonine-protein kinase [Chitinolyticbacter meiyuanensis]